MSLELTILMPCLNEALTIPACVKKAQAFLRDHQIEGEVVVADNGSTDGSRELATELGARVVPVPVRGYGAALAAGIESARGRFVIMGDSDDSYDFSALLPFVEKLREGYDLVMGNRFRGGIAPGAMPPSHRYFGNPMLTWVGRLFFNCKTCGDFYCGLRGFEKRAIQRLDLQSRGMEFALEMLIKAGMNGLRITEVPTTLSPDGRDRPPHLRSYRDGWRSLRLYLLMSPRWFFAVPGFSLLALGAIVIGALLSGPVSIGGVRFDYHTLIYGAAVFVLGYQAIIAGAFAKLIAVEAGLHPPVTKLWFLESRAMFERLLIAGGILGAAGIVLGLFATQQWAAAHFGNLLPADTIRLVVCSVLLLILGGQTALAGCLSGMINLLADRREQKTEERVRRERSAVSRTTDSTFTAIRSEA